MKALLPLHVGTTVIVAVVLFSIGNVKPKTAYPSRDATTLCNEVLYELRLYEPLTETLSADQVDQIINRCRRRFVK